GWVDVDLTDKGREEAVRGGQLLAEEGLLPDIAYTSLLRRAITTANIALDACDRHWIPVVRHWKLNERHYGRLQGLDKAEIKEEYGEEQFMLWRRSYDTPPPTISADDKYSQTSDPRYADLPEVPLTECLKDVVDRFIPYYTRSEEHTSELQSRFSLPTRRSSDLLQWLDKAEIKEEYGEEQFMLWRRSYDTPPPTISADDKYSQTSDPRYADLPEVPLTECLKDVVDRFIPYYT